MLTAQRRDEVGTLEWSHPQTPTLKTWTMPREKSKNDRAHEVQLSPPAVAVLQALPRVSETLVFTTNGARAVSGFSKAKAALDRLMEGERRKQPDCPTRRRQLSPNGSYTI